jgi:branched-subunit amino acid aminotransferase/4-amino-4-deoxychorismate lyase
MDRLRQGAEFLKVKIPFADEALREFSAELVTRNQMLEALLRLTLSRGVGVRGYSPKGAQQPTLVMSLHPVSANDAPVQWKLVTSSFRLPANEPLAQFKTCNKLAQILARAQADAVGADEALLLNTDGHVVEGASSNLFWVESETVCTPPLTAGILAGVTRSVVMEICDKLGIPTRESAIAPLALQKAAGVFLSLSSVGIAECIALDGNPLSRSPVVARVRAAYNTMLANI